MGLVYNHKNKLDLVVLSEEKLEKNEGELCDFIFVTDEDKAKKPAETGDEKPKEE